MPLPKEIEEKVSKADISKITNLENINQYTQKESKKI